MTSARSLYPVDSCRRLIVVWLSIAISPLFLSPPAVAEEKDDDLVPLVLQLLSEGDKDLRALGLDQVRTEAKGEAATKKFAAALPQLSPEAQVGLLRALSDRGDVAARPAVVELLAASRQEAVRAAAICALGALGGTDEVKLLLPLLTSESAALQRAARRSLVRLGGDETPAVIAAELNPASPAVRVSLLEILTERRAVAAIPQIVPWTVGKEAKVRSAAMASLSNIAGPEQLAPMLRGVLAAEKGEERDTAEKAVASVCARVADAAQREQALLKAYEELSADERPFLLPTLGRVGGVKILEIVEAALAGDDAALRAQGLRALCNWPDAQVAPRLFEIAQAEGDAAGKTMVRAALIRVAPLADGRSAADRLESLQRVMSLCANDAERNQLLKRARAIRTVETLRYLLPYMDQPAFAQVACESVVELAHQRELRQANQQEFHQALDRVIKTSHDATVVERAGRYQRNQTWARPAPAVRAEESSGC